MIKASVIIFVCTFLIELNGCSEPAAPIMEKDPRTYSWQVDTISSPTVTQLSLFDIWGASATDVYAVGFTDTYESKMYHFDGSSWSRIPIHTSEGGTVYGISGLARIWGFSPRSIYAVGEKYSNNHLVGVIVHFDGSNWMEIPVDSIGMLQSIWGASESDIWAGGFHTLLRCQSGKWRKIGFPARTDQVQFARITGSSPTDIYFVGVSNGPANPYLYDYRADLYHFDGTNLSIIDSLFVKPDAPPAHFGIEIRYVGRSLFSAQNGIFAFENGRWIQKANTPREITRIDGTSPSSFFLVGAWGTVLHYNGNDTFVYPVGLSNVMFSSVWVHEHGVFAVGTDGSKSYILRGG